MLDRRTVSASLTGAWELFIDRPGALRHFDRSVAGFWRSFAAVLLVLPFDILTLLSARQVAIGDSVTGAFDDTAFAMSSVVLIVLDWVTLPIVMAILARPLGFSRTYATFVIARNWAGPISAIPFAFAALLLVLGVVGRDGLSLLWLAALFILLRYNFIIARRALDAGIALAVAVVVLDFGLSLVLSSAVDALFGL